MTVSDLAAEAQRSRAALEARLETPITTVAPPFGAMNARVESVLQSSGFTRIFDAEGDVAPVWGNRWRIPRMNVGGYESIEDFARMIGAGEPPTPDDRP
ncbi:hypothetical protein EAH87_14740 [Sphingomonas koreensis]|nr:hypothetical protein EAH87_14740 [Sphingomonas koreensis]